MGATLDRSEWTPPDSLWEVNRRLQLDEPLEGPDDARWVDTGVARGEYSHRPLYRVLGVKETADASHRELKAAPDRGYYLFCGHRGCGKSTELRRIRQDLHRSSLYYVVLADAARNLDPNNLRYQDILLHLAAALTRQLQDDEVDINPAYVQRLEQWFADRVEVHEETEEFARQAKAGARVEAGLPFVGKLFAEISNAFKTNSSYKQVLRQTLQNHFTDFADAFNHLIEAADKGVQQANRGQRILFIIDGTDRLHEDDARAFFITDVHQLQQVRGLFVYCAPIHLIYEGNTIEQDFSRVFKLPMIKIENTDGSRNSAGCDAMRAMLFRRAAKSLFDDGVADKLISYSGGHPRDLLRLLQQAFQYAEHDRFDGAAAERAVSETAGMFRRILEPEDYRLLAEIDSTDWAVEQPASTKRTRQLLYDLALLEYNDHYWRSHPAVRMTAAYQHTTRLIHEDADR